MVTYLLVPGLRSREPPEQGTPMVNHQPTKWTPPPQTTKQDKKMRNNYKLTVSLEIGSVRWSLIRLKLSNFHSHIQKVFYYKCF